MNKVKIKNDTDGKVIWCCPNCDKIIIKFLSLVETARLPKCCSKCGLELDWSDMYE